MASMSGAKHCGHFPKLLRCHQTTVNHDEIDPSCFRAIDRSSGNDAVCSGEFHEALRKEAAVAVDDRLPMPRAVEHVEPS